MAIPIPILNLWNKLRLMYKKSPTLRDEISTFNNALSVDEMQHLFINTSERNDQRVADIVKLQGIKNTVINLQEICILFDLRNEGTREREFVYNEHVFIENGEAALDKENYKKVERDNTSAECLSEDIYVGNNYDDEYDFTWGSLQAQKEISQEKLVIENITGSSRISGNRIVEID